MNGRKAYIVKTNKTGGHVVAAGKLHAWWHASRPDAIDFAACMNFAHDRAVRLERARARRAAKRKPVKARKAVRR